MRTFTAIVEKCSDTGLYVGYVPGFPGAHSQGDTLEELNHNLKEVIEMLLEDGELEPEHEFVGTQNIVVNMELLRSSSTGPCKITERLLLPGSGNSRSQSR
jgi:predicted RNase H-like HicB family nuclease